MKTFITILAIISVATAFDTLQDGDVDQTKINAAFDSFLLRYVNLTRKTSVNGAVNSSRTAFFTYGGSVINGRQVVNETKFFGLDDLERAGNITLETLAKNSFNVKGQLLLAGPKVEGSVYLAYGATPKERASYTAIAANDIGFEFAANINTKWNQIVITNFNYNTTVPSFPITMSCSDAMKAECQAITNYVTTAVKEHTADIKLLVRDLLSKTPLKSN